jgi:NAD(P)-dependent dehydrogenase (short-subunit alcohol dehydrogenase family)
VSALAGRHALVTGANRGIGAAIARALSAEGAKVTLLVRDASRAEATVSTLVGPHAIVVADVTQRAEVEAAIAGAVNQLGPVDILVNNAGYTESAPFQKTTPDLFERMFAVHVLGAVYTSQMVLPGMIERGRGRIVNVASIAGVRGEAYVSAYVAAKHALVGLTRAMAREVEKRGVAVNAVCPGYADTALVHDSVARVAAKTGRSSADALAAMLANAGQQRLVTPDEIAAAVVELCTSPPDAPSGRTVILDGSGP